MRIDHLLGALLLSATPAMAKASATRPLVLELFTSQGCSSCPPADELLVELAADHPELLPLAFHVTYWNALGWHDPYSLDAATRRQSGYAAVLRQDSVYTPELVVDGRRGVVGSDRQAVGSAIDAAKGAAAAPLGLRLHRGLSGLGIEVGAGTGTATLWLVGFDPQHRTQIGRGENGGRTLLEANIVRSLAPAAAWVGSPLHVQAALPAGEQYAAFLQAPDGRMLDAARLEN